MTVTRKKKTKVKKSKLKTKKSSLKRRKNPDQKYYVITDMQDPGSEHDSYEEARKILLQLQKKGFRDARIIGPGCGPDYDERDYYDPHWGSPLDLD